MPIVEYTVKVRAEVTQYNPTTGADKLEKSIMKSFYGTQNVQVTAIDVLEEE